MDYDARPTVTPFPYFDAQEDAATLKDAMKGLGTDEEVILDLITSRCNIQRQEIHVAYNEEYDRDLVNDLKGELGGNFENVIVALMDIPEVFICKELCKSLEGMGTDEEALIELLCTRTNEEILEIAKAYEELYDRPLTEHLCSETSGHFRRLLTLIVTGTRDAEDDVTPENAEEDAAKLYNAGEEKLGTDEAAFNKIFAHSSFAHLKLVFDKYKEMSGRTIEQAIKGEMDGEIHDALMAIVECVQSPAAFFARQLNKSIEGVGTDDDRLIRILVSRSEVDLETIKDEYERIFDKTLISAISNETSGDYKRCLIALLK